jgi:hypothetical protein
VQDFFLLVLDNCFKAAWFKDMPEQVAITSPTIGSELHKLKESAPSTPGLGAVIGQNHAPGLVQFRLRG